jgi:hypothetical protein
LPDFWKEWRAWVDLKEWKLNTNKNGKINDVVIIPQVVEGRKGK